MTSEKYYEKAEIYYINRQYEKALSCFKKSYDLKKTNDCLNYIGCCYLELNNYISAINIFSKLNKNSPGWERPIFNLGRVYLKTENFKKALSYFQKAIFLNPDNSDTYYYLGVYYDKIEEYERAKTYYEKSLVIDNKQSETHLNLGMCYFRLNDYENALKEFNLAYDYDNNCTDAIKNQGLVFLSMKDYNDALEKFLFMSEVEPDDIENMLDIAFCYYRINNLENAHEWINRIMKIDANNEEANKLLKAIIRRSSV
ncbi:tetratricopeptide repeat protein [Desulfosporosinus shakirovi]|uniref:tetratricopeptide repeat protein n=1 Tax=Desulfosporosinus shakirovi TaxID=2885154 RepID=UPI001E497066|nr:tetratricopeptide repeat protein [Desulfosporosinus sp. SRJS8]MCB8818803.1 tetratricopeptide repeat protein [Desulfosporosinus sp. SRJS8]